MGKLYIAVFSNHIESDGLYSSVQVYLTKEAACAAIKEEYDRLHDIFNSEECFKEFYDDELTDDSFYINLENTYGYEYFEAHVEELEVKGGR